MNTIAIVTGANSGLGFETSLAFAKKGINTILACRNLEKAEKARKEIIHQHSTASLEIIPLDLNSFESVRNFAQIFKEKYSTLNILVNNAGFMATHFELSKDGFESQYQTNFFGHFLLTGLLLPILKNTTNSRIISLASIAHRFGTINTNEINTEKGYIPFKVYCNTKLAFLMFSNLLNEKLKDSNVISVAAHPGISITNISNKLSPILLKLQTKLGKLFMSNQSEGAESTVFAALETSVIGGGYYGPSGLFEIKGKPKSVGQSRYSRNKNLARELWSYAESVTGIEY